MAITEAVRAILGQFTNGPPLTIFERPPNMPPPMIATIREIVISPVGGRLLPRYARANYEVDIANYPSFNELLRRVANDGVPLPDDGPPKAPFRSQLSLKNKKYCYVIFKLVAQEWQFSHDLDPFSIGQDSTIPEVYFEPRKVDENGDIVPRGTERHNCRIAYMIADGATAYETSHPYEDPFNLHLDLLDEDSGGLPSPVPIVIDPDIRFPGGSGEA